jgi:hypothetical protein
LFFPADTLELNSTSFFRNPAISWQDIFSQVSKQFNIEHLQTKNFSPTFQN